MPNLSLLLPQACQLSLALEGNQSCLSTEVGTRPERVEGLILCWHREGTQYTSPIYLCT
jgi:hypothetical protein